MGLSRQKVLLHAVLFLLVAGSAYAVCTCGWKYRWHTKVREDGSGDITITATGKWSKWDCWMDKPSHDNSYGKRGKCAYRFYARNNFFGTSKAKFGISGRCYCIWVIPWTESYNATVSINVYESNDQPYTREVSKTWNEDTRSRLSFSGGDNDWWEVASLRYQTTANRDSRGTYSGSSKFKFNIFYFK